ncbi:MAG: hypothetical protein RIS36_1237 [Pseudomonadota bacterium]|jgi:hypothetical protein
MKKAKTILKIGLLGIAAMAVWVMYSESVRNREMLCQMTYFDFDTEIKAALAAEGVDKLVHLQAAQMVMHMLYQKDCCRFESTCPAGLRL